MEKIQPSPLMKASLSHYIALRDKAISELDIYINRPSGVGGHEKVTEEVISLFKELNEAKGIIDTITGIINDNSNVTVDLEKLDKAKKDQKESGTTPSN